MLPQDACRIPTTVDRQNPSESPVNPPSDRSCPGWWVPVVLASPALIPLINSLIVARLTGLVATGFIQIDQPSYFANAREFFDQGFHLLYGNPYAGYDTPRIYFQPQFFLLGCLQQLGLDPGITWGIGSVLGALFAAFVAVRFYCEAVGWQGTSRKLGLLCFFWGGGILTLVGLVYAAIVGRFNALTILHFDIGRGWWMLNFGRNLVYAPTEAYYHGLFLLSMLFLLRRQFGAAIACCAVLCLSHPYTGVEGTLIVMVYLGLERLLGNTSVKPIHIVLSVALFLLHIGYYMFFLNRFAVHRVVENQIRVRGASWIYPPSAFLPALAIVGLLTIVTLWHRNGFLKAARDPQKRLFLVWFVIVFALTQHDKIMKPTQPIHFAHGYDWTALFFLGAPTLLLLLERLRHIDASWLRVTAISAFMVFFLFDNLFWFATFLKPNMSQAILITRQHKEVLNWLNGAAVPPDLVVTADPMLGYLVSTYTRVRSWAGNGINTPNFADRTRESEQAFQDGVILPAWENMHVFYVQRLPVDAQWKPPANAREAFRDSRYCVWECPPGRGNQTPQMSGESTPKSW
jgi:hypothetical protein